MDEVKTITVKLPAGMTEKDGYEKLGDAMHLLHRDLREELARTSWAYGEDLRKKADELLKVDAMFTDIKANVKRLETEALKAEAQSDC